MKLSDICRVAAEGQDSVNAEELFGTLAVIRGCDAWGDAEAGFLYQPCRAPERLSLDMEFEDAYMRLEHIGHYPMTLLFFHESEQLLTAAILGESSVFNRFTSLTAAFRNGKKSPFACYYRAPDGTEQAFNPEHGLGFDHVFPNRRLEWIG